MGQTNSTPCPTTTRCPTTTACPTTTSCPSTTPCTACTPCAITCPDISTNIILLYASRIKPDITKPSRYIIDWKSTILPNDNNFIFGLRISKSKDFNSYYTWTANIDNYIVKQSPYFNYYQSIIDTLSLSVNDERDVKYAEIFCLNKTTDKAEHSNPVNIIV
jgi:hypothetical protein